MKGWKQTDHRNLILARKSEEWIIDQIREFTESSAVVERVLEKAIANTSKNLQPQIDALALTQSALRKNQDRTEQMFAMMESDKVNDSLLAMLNQRATTLGRRAAQIIPGVGPNFCRIRTGCFSRENGDVCRTSGGSYTRRNATSFATHSAAIGVDAKRRAQSGISLYTGCGSATPDNRKNQS